ncbi:hypothetical protein SRHO_G00048300 [Serrasalmus rhombeus]
MRQNRKIFAVVYSRLVFNSSSPGPSESLVLYASGTLLSSRRTNLSESTEILNITYDYISEASYAITFIFNVTNISMPESSVLMNDTYIQVKNSINLALNTLLNERSAELFEPQTSNFRMLENQIEGNMQYSFQEGDAKTPISFLNELKTQTVSTTTVSPMTTSRLIVTSAATHSKIPTSAVVYSRLVFKSSSPVPSESLVLNATNTLLKSRRANLSNSTQVLNVTYEKISETSYAVIFTISVSNISMPESPVLMNGTYTQLKNSVNIALNTLLNEPSAELFEPQSSDFRTSANQVDGNMQYSFQEGDTKTPISFLNELKTQTVSTTTVSPMTTSRLIVTSAATHSKIPTSAVVYSRLVFKSSSPVPSESLVLNATNTLLKSRRANLSNSTQVLNVTYEKISETSYAVIFTISVSNISMPESPVLMNGTYTQLKNSVNIALNTLLNEPSAELFEPQSSDFRTSANQVDGNMQYSFQEGDAKTPISFLNELKTQTASPTTVSPMTTSRLIVTSAATHSKIPTSAVVYSRLVFKSSSPVPSESLVLNATNTLLKSRRANLSNSTQVLNVTYEKISETSYAVIFTISVSNISMPESPVLMNGTYTQLKNSVNIALNTLLNEPSAELFEPQSSDFRTSANQVDGNMQYSFQEGDAKTPISFLNELKTQTASPTTVSPMTTSNLPATSAATPSKIPTSAVVYSRLVFKSSSPVPSESLVLNATNTLLKSRRANLSNSTQVLNVTYEKISETSYAIIFTISVSNISMPESPVLMKGTYTQLKNSVNIALNTLLNEPSAELFEPQSSDFRTSANQVDGNMQYSFQEGDAKTPMSFLNELKTQSGNTPTMPPIAITALQSTTLPTPEISTTSVLDRTTSTIMKITTSPTPDITAAPPQQITAAPTLVGTVLIYIRLVFKNLTTLPSEAEVLNAASALLDSSVRMKRDVSTQKLNNPVSIQNVTYQKTGSNSYTISFAFKISNVNISKNIELRNETYDAIQNTINGLLNKILNNPNAPPFVFQRANYTGNDTVIQANAEYVFVEGDIKTPSGFLKEILNIPERTTSTIMEITTSSTLDITTVPHQQNTIAPTLEITAVPPQQITAAPPQQITAAPPQQITAAPPQQITAAPPQQITVAPTLVGTVLIYIRLVFKNLTTLPSEAEVLNAANTLLDSSVRMKRDVSTQKLNNPVSIQNVTYQKTSSNSYTISFAFKISNVNMSKNIELRNETYDAIQNTINGLLNKILNNPNAPPFVFQRANYTGNDTVIQANAEYVFVEGDIKTPSGFLKEILNIPERTTSTIMEITTSSTLDITTVPHQQNTIAPTLEITAVPPQQITAAPPQQITAAPPQQITAAPPQQITAAPPQQITVAPTLVGTVLIYIRLVFKNLTTLPSEAEVLNAANTLLDSSVRMKRDVSTQKLNNPVSIQNVTYQKTSSNSYTISFAFKISNVNMSKNIELRNETYDAIQNTINGLLNKILNDPNAPPIVFQRANYTGNDTVIQANAEYVFVEGDIKTPSGFLKEILKISGLAGGGFPGWALAIIIPCGIAIILVPCWIILCIMLSGCCGAIRRRWHRRRSYNVEYPIHNSLF